MSFKVAFTVSTEAQARELDAAWHEIVLGQRLPRSEALEESTEAIMERARPALERIEAAIRNHPTTGQAGRLVRFLAGLYNGHDYPFDLTELRALDTDLANAALDYLNYDRLGKREVHHHLSGGDRELHQWLRDYAVERAPQLDEHETDALVELSERSGRDRDDLLREAIKLLVASYPDRPPSPTR